jgi:hypothetical protein
MKKVGFSASRCIRDIVEEKVDIYDVVSITTGTMCEDFTHWIQVMEAYMQVEQWDSRSLAGLDRDKVLRVATELWESGKIHQPRCVGAHRSKSPYVWMDLVHTSEDREASPALRSAWDRAQMVETLITGEDPLNPQQPKPSPFYNDDF